MTTSGPFSYANITQAKRRAKTKRGKRYLATKEPKVLENPKAVMFVRGPGQSADLTDLMKDLAKLKQPLVVKYGRKTEIRPFDDPSSLQFFSHKSDASLFVHGSGNKKRPSNLTLGRFFNLELLDMFEFGVQNYVTMSSFGGGGSKATIGTKPAIVLDGPEWEDSERHRIMANFFVDFFQGKIVSSYNLATLDHAIVLTAHDGIVHFRHYAVVMKRSGTRIPRVELAEIGPSFDMVPRRAQLAPDELRADSLKQPPELKAKKRKNVTTNVFGETIGRIHMPRQELGTMQVKRVKALKKKRKTDDGE